MLPFFLLLAQTAGAAPAPNDFARSYELASTVLGETRTIDVTLPRGYGSDTTRRYPVLFVLDGEFEHEIAAAVARFYAAMGELPPTIVVGIRNTDRSRDMMPPPVPGFRVPDEATNAGGAARFLSFISDELIPHVDRTYRTAPMRVLIGHSLGGLFTIYTLAERPERFTGYIALEPSTWWNNEHERAAARTALGRPGARRARVMLVNAQSPNLDTTAWGGTTPMIRELRVTGETHSSMALAGMMTALRTMFADFKPTPWQPGKRPIAMVERYDSLAERIGYAVPIPGMTYSTVTRMSLDSRHFDDAARVLDRWERAHGASSESREFRERLRRERASATPAGFVALEFPARRPTPQQARAFLGRWVAIGPDTPHNVEIRASGDTIVVQDSIQLPNGEWFVGNDPVIQVTPDGTLEWGLPFFRGLAALLVLRARIEPDATMLVTREVRGWVPRGPTADLTRTTRFRKLTRSF